MPSSFIEQIPIVINHIKGIAPKSILEVGTGYAKYGHLIREYIDVYPWGIKMHGVEAFPEYLDRMGCSPYDKLFCQDFLDINFRNTSYDLVVMIDVIEHFAKEEGVAALKKALWLAPNVLVATPATPGEQGAEYGNEYERHLSVWGHEDFSALGTWYSDGSFPPAVIGVLERA